MNLRRFAFRTANRFLEIFGLELSPIAKDFDARILSGKHLDRIFATLTQISSDYLFSQTIIAVKQHYDIESEIRGFYSLYIESPFRMQYGGSRFGNLLWLDLIAKSLQPDVIVDSGTYLGGSAWALSHGSPASRILSFDIDLSRLLLRCPNVEYIERDWTTFDFEPFRADACLVYFDDLLDQGRRLKETAERGFRLVLFNDDFSVLNFVTMAHGGSALPKISFLLDPDLKDGEIIEWTDGKRQFQWKVDRSEFDKLKSLIYATDRLPSLGAPLGIEQLPYRIVVLGDGLRALPAHTAASMLPD